MSAEQTLMTQGKCPECSDGILQHGPWSQEQMQEVAADIGMDVADFIDQCDDCFVRFVGLGDAKYAQTLSPDLPLVLREDTQLSTEAA